MALINDLKDFTDKQLKGELRRRADDLKFGINLDHISEAQRLKIVEYLAERMKIYVNAHAFSVISEMLDRYWQKTIRPEEVFHVEYKLSLKGFNIIEAINFTKENDNE